VTDDELREIVERLREVGDDSASIEAKAARTGVPKSIRETLSAFQNTHGGVVVLGLDEKSGFAAVGVDAPAKTCADLASLCAQEMEPPVRPLIATHRFDGVALVVVEVPELDPAQRPSYYRGLGMNRGSFVRVNDGDQHLTTFEVQMMLASRGQPTDDEQAVAKTTADDLDPELTATYVARMRRERPRIFADATDAEILLRTGVTTREGSVTALTIAGLLALGAYPQEFLPQVSLTFVRYPTIDGPAPDGTRFLDNVHVEGPIPFMVRDALGAIRSNMSRRAVIAGAGRVDVWEYPEVALREAVTNALVHRDLSPASRGTQIQVEMYPDRLVIRNPGGLFGPVSVETIGGEGLVSSARNARLMKILEDVEVAGLGVVCENRGSGVRDMRIALRQAGMRPPELVDRISTFTVTIPNHALLGDEVVRWIAGLHQAGLTESQVIGLAIMRSGQALDNVTYRTAATLDSRVATAELQDLVNRGLVVQDGGRRWATYTLAEGSDTRPGSTARTAPRRADRRAEILEALGGLELARADIAVRTGLSDGTVGRWLRRLRQEGAIEGVGEGSLKSPHTRYRGTT
jgi:ATP-dependent DNA helicase RecG